ncbi:hypothetical protein DV096_09865 [Bradymonadaceae bacterium TMQ3]|nr:hypothetical protein DV096_09865 [Bradymonadaceae bacterium TMQ3]TXC75783.1 hypothetical protein FRC91_09775 [Bradymonadales bacterium TMQ1]
MNSPSLLIRQTLIPLLLAIAISPALLACKSTSTAEREVEAQPQPITVTGPEDLLQTEDTLVSMRVRFGGELPALLRSLSDDPTLETVAAGLEDPVSLLVDHPHVDVDLSLLNTDRPIYLSFSSLGNEDFLQAASLGLPTREEEWPTFMLNRLLLPTDDPAQLAIELEKLFAYYSAENPDDPMVTRSYEGPGFLRVEVATPVNLALSQGENLHKQAHAWLDSLDLEILPIASDAYRPTAAFNAYANSESELALWTRHDRLARFGTLQRAMDEEYPLFPHGDEADDARTRFEAISTLAVNSMVNDPMAAEFEDLSLHIDATKAGGMTLDAVLTRTARGARIAEASRSTVMLPQIPGSHALSLDWSLDLQALAREVDVPFWLEAFDTPAAGGSMGFDERLARLASSESGIAIVVTALQSPFALMNSEALDDTTVPLARAGTVRAFTLPAGSPFPVGLAATLLFDPAPGRQSQLQTLLKGIESNLPFAFEFELRPVDDSRIELQLVMGASLFEVFHNADTFELSEASAEANLDKLGPLRALISAQQGLDQLDHLTLRFHDDDAYQSIRLGIDADDQTAALTPEHDVPLIPTPSSRCRTELAAAAFTHLHDLSVDGAAKVERYLETFNERAERCLGPDHPYAAEAETRLNRVRQWAVELGEDPSLSASAR